MAEIWKSWISPTGTTYQVSSHGRIKRPDGKFTGLCLRAGYRAFGSKSRSRNIYWIRNVHRIVAQLFVENPEKKPFVDHIDQNKTNNRADNLRWVTRSENQQNSDKHKGYYFSKRDKKWYARIRFGGKRHFLGLFKTKDEARAAYLAAKKKFHPCWNPQTTDPGSARGGGGPGGGEAGR